MAGTLISSTQRMYVTQFWTQAAGSFWNSDSEGQSATELMEMASQQQSDMVDICLSGVGQRMTEDMAAVTASYLADKTELQDEYALVIVNDPTSGWEARAFRRSDLVEGLEGEEREEVLAALEENPLVYLESAESLPETPDDSELAGLAEAVQEFLDKNENVLDILVREGSLTWAS